MRIQISSPAHSYLLSPTLTFPTSPFYPPAAPVSNLAVDLRDGLRLCKLAEALGGRPGLFDAARFPSDKCGGGAVSLTGSIPAAIDVSVSQVAVFYGTPSPTATISWHVLCRRPIRLANVALALGELGKAGLSLEVSKAAVHWLGQTNYRCRLHCRQG